MTIKPTIKVEAFATDISQGMNDNDLMNKYSLDPEEFMSVLAHLIDAGLVTRQQLEERQSLSESQIIRLFVESREDSETLA